MRHPLCAVGPMMLSTVPDGLPVLADDSESVLVALRVADTPLNQHSATGHVLSVEDEPVIQPGSGAYSLALEDVFSLSGCDHVRSLSP